MVHGSGLHVADGIWETASVKLGIARLQLPHTDAAEEGKAMRRWAGSTLAVSFVLGGMVRWAGGAAGWRCQ
jgi:hypothetical protein